MDPIESDSCCQVQSRHPKKGHPSLWKFSGSYELPPHEVQQGHILDGHKEFLAVLWLSELTFWVSIVFKPSQLTCELLGGVQKSVLTSGPQVKVLVVPMSFQGAPTRGRARGHAPGAGRHGSRAPSPGRATCCRAQDAGSLGSLPSESWACCFHNGVF